MAWNVLFKTTIIPSQTSNSVSCDNEQQQVFGHHH